MRLQTIVYVKDMMRSVEFYEALDFEVEYRGGPMWTAFGGTDGALALHLVEKVPPGGGVAVSLVADRSLEEITTQLADVGIEATPIEVQPFGRSMVVRDPDGLAIQINEHSS